MISASGAIILSKNTGRVCLQQRSEMCSYPGTWGVWGGKAEPGELPIEALIRELREEMGSHFEIIKTYPLHRFESVDGNFEYNTFVVLVEDEFTPKLNVESSDYIWIDLNNHKLNLHPGVLDMLKITSVVNKINQLTSIVNVN